jgi:hypothetical protein
MSCLDGLYLLSKGGVLWTLTEQWSFKIVAAVEYRKSPTTLMITSNSLWFVRLVAIKRLSAKALERLLSSGIKPIAVPWIRMRLHLLEVCRWLFPLPRNFFPRAPCIHVQPWLKWFCAQHHLNAHLPLPKKPVAIERGRLQVTTESSRQGWLSNQYELPF